MFIKGPNQIREEGVVARILAFAGSTRAGSYNQRLAALAARAAQSAGADVRLVCLKDYALPVYDSDFEADYGLVDNVRALKRLFTEADGLLISTPEYNASLSAVLKNALDWVSRPCEGETATTLSCFRGKVAGLLSASPDPLGGVRALGHMREILAHLQVTTLPEQVCVPFAHEAFDDLGLKDARLQGAVETLGRRVAAFAAYGAAA